MKQEEINDLCEAIVAIDQVQGSLQLLRSAGFSENRDNPLLYKAVLTIDGIDKKLDAVRSFLEALPLEHRVTLS